MRSTPVYMSPDAIAEWHAEHRTDPHTDTTFRPWRLETYTCGRWYDVNDYPTEEAAACALEQHRHPTVRLRVRNRATNEITMEA